MKVPWETRAAMRQRLLEYRTAVSRLAGEKLRLQRQVLQSETALAQAQQKIRNTESFLAVLQGEQINTTELN